MKDAGLRSEEQTSIARSGAKANGETSPMVGSPENGDYPPGILSCVHFALVKYSPIRQSGGCRCRLTEGPNGHGLVIHDVKNGIQLCNLYHVLDLFHEVEQLQFSPLLPHTGEGTDKMAQA